MIKWVVKNGDKYIMLKDDYTIGHTRNIYRAKIFDHKSEAEHFCVPGSGEKVVKVEISIDEINV